jgi:mannose-6-phosphate isomerase-like protein (cupin superfamily)
MKLKVFLFVMATGAVAALPTGYSHWTEEQMASRAKGMPAKMTKVKVATEPLGAWGNHSMSLIHREGSGEAELHETKADILFIRSGEAAIIVGGTMPGAHPTTAHEVRAPKIEGGEKQALHAGDVLHIAAKTPHQMILEPGQKLDYYAVKVDAR